MNGVVSRILRDKGFGFIKADNGKEFFFHRSALQNSDFDTLTDNASVTFDEGQGKKGPRAERIFVNV